MDEDVKDIDNKAKSTEIEQAIKNCKHGTVSSPIPIALTNQFVLVCTACGKTGKVVFDS